MRYLLLFLLLAGCASTPDTRWDYTSANQELPIVRKMCRATARGVLDYMILGFNCRIGFAKGGQVYFNGEMLPNWHVWGEVQHPVSHEWYEIVDSRPGRHYMPQMARTWRQYGLTFIGYTSVEHWLLATIDEAHQWQNTPNDGLRVKIKSMWTGVTSIDEQQLDAYLESYIRWLKYHPIYKGPF
jgi:hypothetical protein